MPIRFDVSCDPGITPRAVLLRRADGQAYDFAAGTFVPPAAPLPAGLSLALPPRGTLAGEFWLAYTPSPPLPDGDYTRVIVDPAHDNRVLQKSPCALRNNDDATPQ